jgi:2,3,4,5-tetrahydropyridine-2-carboxylate N-succinyltransferase
MNTQRIGHRYIDVETGKTLDVWFPTSNTRKSRGCLAEKVGLIKGEHIELPLPSLDVAPTTTEDVYLRLHLLSERAVKPNEVNLDGLFTLLPNIAWTSAGPVFPAQVERLRDLVAAEHHHLTVPSIIVGDHSDIGAGASIMGTLSGGGKQKNRIGERSLLGANAGIGISLGDECIVEAGLYVTSGTKVKMPDGTIVAARELSGRSGLLFRRNSQSGAVEVLPTDASRWGGLNTTLHVND